MGNENSSPVSEKRLGATSGHQQRERVPPSTTGGQKNLDLTQDVPSKGLEGLETSIAPNNGSLSTESGRDVGAGGEREVRKTQIAATVTSRRKGLGLKVFSSSDVRAEKVIGDGGFGKVLQGIMSQGPVAYKMFHTPIPLAKIREQLSTLVNLNHRNLVTVLGILRSGEVDCYCPQVVMPFFSEGNLLQYLSKPENPQDYAMLGKLALDISDGCEYLHKMNVIHANLAARNVLVEKCMSKQKTHFNAKITDYGIGRLAEGSGGNFVKIPNGLVVPVRWVPKELIDGNEATTFTFQSDVWSFGVVLWEMWTKGAVPFGATYTNSRVMEFLREGESPLSIHRPKRCPDHIVGVMEGIFKVNPDDRPSFTTLKETFTKYKDHGREKKAVGNGTDNQCAGKDENLQSNVKIQANEMKEPRQGAANGYAAGGVADKPKPTSGSEQGQSKKKTVGKPGTGDGGVSVGREGGRVLHNNQPGKLRKNGDEKTTEQRRFTSHKNTRGHGGLIFKAPPKSQGRGFQNREAVATARINRTHYHQGSEQFYGGGFQQTQQGLPGLRVPSLLPTGQGLFTPAGMMPAPPPPYTPHPLPDHSLALTISGFPMPSAISNASRTFAASSADYDRHIKEQEEKLQALKTAKRHQEIIEKAAELTELVQGAVGSIPAVGVDGVDRSFEGRAPRGQNLNYGNGSHRRGRNAGRGRKRGGPNLSGSNTTTGQRF